MARLEDAERARDEHSERLRQLGAHAIEVRERGRGDYAVIAHFTKRPKSVPDELEVALGSQKRTVPVEVEISEEFKPE